MSIKFMNNPHSEQAIPVVASVMSASSAMSPATQEQTYGLNQEVDNGWALQ